MLSKSPAPKYLLIVPLVLLILVIVLSFVVFQNFRAVATNTPAANQEEKGTPQPQDGNGDYNVKPDTNKNNDNDVMHKIPAGYYPANKCPEKIVKEQGSGNNFAIESNEKYSLSGENATWISTNCPNTQTINY